MALIKCKECKSEVSNTAKACPKCGAKVPPKTGLITKLVAVVIGIGALGAIFGGSGNKTAQQTASVSAPATNPAGGWDYSVTADKMTGKPTKYSILKSTNSLNLKFPYSGQNHGYLQVRKKDGKAEDVIFHFDKGQSMCRSYNDGCNVQVRFDQSQPVTFNGTNPSDGSSNAVFLSSPGTFIAAAKKAKAIKVSLELYQAGTQVLEFQSSMPLR